MESRCVGLKVRNDLTLYHSGPSLDHGPLPSLFYFALSGPDSLCLDPYSQPVQFLSSQMIRVFSLTLPAHENNLPATQAVETWSQDYERGQDPIGEFLEDCAAAVSFAIEQKFADPKKLAAAGLSRGGLIAFHLAARDDRFRHILAFAPVTKLSKVKEFSNRNLDPSLDAELLAPSLADRHFRIYIGNRDTRVGTRSCFDFAMALTENAAAKKIRTPQIEMIITPSIGQHGHGTSPEVFRQGADWISSSLIGKK